MKNKANKETGEQGITIATLADITGYRQSKIRNLIRLKHVKGDGDDIDVTSALEYFCEQFRKIVSERESQMARYNRVRADLSQLSLEVKNGELVPARQVAASISIAGQLLKNVMADAIARLPDRLAEQTARSIAPIIEKELLDILAAFSAELRKADRVESK